MNKPTRIILILTAAICAMLGIGVFYEKLVQPQELVWSDKAISKPITPLSVTTSEDFKVPAQSAVKLWNNITPLFLIGSKLSTVRILSANGEPCGKFSIHETEGHSATAYECSGGSWEIHISKPGDLHTQFCIIAHELGHVLGLADDKAGSRVMNQKVCPEMLLVSDKDRAAVLERFKQ